MTGSFCNSCDVFHYKVIRMSGQTQFLGIFHLSYIYMLIMPIMNIEKGWKTHKLSTPDLNESWPSSVKKIFSIAAKIAHTAVQLCSKRNLNPTFEVRF